MRMTDHQFGPPAAPAIRDAFDTKPMAGDEGLHLVGIVGVDVHLQAEADIEKRIAGRDERREELGSLGGASHLFGLAAGARSIELTHGRAVLPDAMALPAVVAQFGGHARLPVTMKADAMK